MDFLYKQFEMSRHMFLQEVNQAKQEVLDVQPNGFNNNIHWHAGHVLTITEQLLFGFPHNASQLPKNYNNLFGNGSSPAYWPEDVPSVDELTDQLQKQLERMKEIPRDKFNQQLSEPVLGAETFGELAAMTMIHESNHTGRVNAIKKAIG